MWTLRVGDVGLWALTFVRGQIWISKNPIAFPVPNGAQFNQHRPGLGRRQGLREAIETSDKQIPDPVWPP